MKPFPLQIAGATFLADRRNALLADEPRVGKTGAAIMACDLALDQSVLVVTTVSGLPIWQRAWHDWPAMKRSAAVMTGPFLPKTDVVIVPWSQVGTPSWHAELLKRRWSRLLPDEAHNAKNFDAKRTQAVYGRLLEDDMLAHHTALANHANGVWPLTGTPMPNSPADLYPMLRSLAPGLLLANEEMGWPAVTAQSAFIDRYCVRKPKRISRFNTIMVVVGGRNEAELRARLAQGDGFMLRRTQKDAGIGQPIFEMMPLAVTSEERRQAEADVDTAAIMAAAEAGNTKDLEMHLGPLRRLTGTIKAAPIVRAARDEFDGGLDKLVIAYWHRAVGDDLSQKLEPYGVLRIDGSTPQAQRGAIEQAFRTDPKKRVMLAQIQAAGEAVDFSAAAVLWFAESSFIPKDMKQMSLRVTNYTQKRQVFVRVCVIENTVDEAIQTVLARKWSSIREVYGT